MKNRDAAIDIAKGIGIFLVVLGHVPIPMKVAIPIYMFHMPLFFFLSGMFFNSREKFGYGLYKKFRTLIVPYFFFAFCGNLSNSLRDVIFSHTIKIHSIWQLFNGMVTPLWFLICLFFCYMICKMSESVLRNWRLLCMASAIWGGVGIFLSSRNIRLPLWGTQALLMQFYYVMGYVCKNIEFRGISFYARCMKARRVVWLASLFGFIICCIPFEIRPNVSTLDFYHPFSFIFGSLLGIFLCLVLSKRISKSKTFLAEYFRQIGNRSLFVLGFHFYLIFHFYFFSIPLLMRTLSLFSLSIEGNYLRESYWLGVLFVLPSIYISMYLGTLCMRFLSICFKIKK